TNVLPTPSFQPYDAPTAEKFCYRQHRGVNLGGMFVLEAWLCPDHLRNAVKNGQWQSEMDFLLACESNSQARELLEYHWSSFITPKDIGELAAAGINAVRIPIGYYIVNPRDMLTGQHKDDAYFRFADVYDAAMGYLLRLVHECEKHGIGVLIDIHAAPGGQNASDHCGMAMPCKPHFFSSRRCQNYMLAILAKLVQLFSPLNHVIGIGLLNEPIDDPGLMAYYQTACDTVLKNTPNGQRALPLYLGDAWNAYKYMDRISQQLLPRYPFVVLETHAYFCHTPQDHQQVAQQHMANAEKMANSLQDRGKVVRNNVSVGEWAMVLNGQSMTGMDERQTMAQFGQWQLQLYDKATAAHFYWTYKTAD
ncbi:glycoside hydrolase superfamily, partial [Gongronella butleri]